MKKQSLLRITALLMAMLMVLAVFAGCKSKNKKDDDDDVDTSASAVFRNALTGFFTDLGELPVLKTWLNMCQNGSLELEAKVDAGQLAASMGETGVSGSMDAGYKYYFNGTGILMENIHMNMKYPEENIDVNVSGDIYYGTDYIYVKNDNILGGAIGLIPGKTADAFENSVWKDMIPSEYLEIIVQVLKMYDGEMNDTAQSVIDDIKPVAERYIEVISDSLEKNARFVEEVQTVTVGGEAVESRVVTLVIDKDAVVGFINDLYNAVKNDSELRSLIVKYGDMLENYVGMSGAEIGMQYDELLSMLGESLGELEAEIPEFAVMASVTTPTNASTLRKLEISFRDGGEGAESMTLFTLDLGKNGVKDTNRISVNIAGEIIANYEIIKNDESGYKASLVVSAYGETQTIFTMDVDRKAGTYSISVPMGDFAMGGTFMTEGDKTTIVFNSIKIDGETYNKGFSATLIIDENDPMPSLVNKNDVKNVFELTEGDVEAIIDRAEAAFGDLFDRVGGKAEESLWLPEGYQPYNNGELYFAYPESWYCTYEGDYVRMTDSANAKHNIVVTSVDRTDYYETLTEEKFKSDILPQLEARGYKMSGSALVQQWGSGNALITELVYWAEHNGADVYQVVLIVNSGSRTYIVCLSSPDGNSEALSNLYYTLTATDY